MMGGRERFKHAREMGIRAIGLRSKRQFEGEGRGLFLFKLLQFV
jgi:hypothetical protein